MDKIRILQNVIYIISTLGILMGVDLLLGAKITSKLNKILDATVLDFDRIITGVLSHFKKSVEVRIDVDSRIIKTKARTVLGFLFIVTCAVLIYVAKQE